MPLFRRTCFPPLAVALLAMTICSSLTAQTVRGTVLDSASSQPLGSASIELVRADSQVIARERSNNDGQFRARARGAGPYRIRVQRIGYRPLESVLQISGDTTLQLTLAPNPVELSAMGVTAEMYPYLKTSGFLDRLAAGTGTFITPAMVGKKSPKSRYAVDLMEGIPGVRLQMPANGGSVRVPYLRSCGSDPRRRVMTITGLVDTTELGNVYPGIYVDAAKVEQDVFGWLLPTHILAIEIYMGPAEIPLQYGGTGAPCGVILIWTKR